jgi:hypothetical protein
VIPDVLQVQVPVATIKDKENFAVGPVYIIMEFFIMLYRIVMTVAIGIQTGVVHVLPVIIVVPPFPVKAVPLPYQPDIPM